MKGVALITGGQQGIGLGIAKALAEAGFDIALVSLPEPDAASVRAALLELGEQARYFQHDVSKIDDVPKLLDRIEAEMGGITTLVNNAGVGVPVRGDMLQLRPENWDAVLDVNLRGAFFLSQAVAKSMLATKSDSYRSIIFVTSVSSKMVSIERAEYCVSKAGASMMTELFAVRLAPHGIGVFELRPGIIATDMTSGVKDKYTDQIEGGLVPARRWGEPGDVGEIIVPLATGQMRFANGASIPVDGGLSIARL